MNEMRRLMNLMESPSSRIVDILSDTVTEYNRIADPKGKGADGRITFRPPSSRVWTRGDGTRHRDPAKILVYNDENPNTEKYLRAFWEWLVEQPGARPAGKISGEFGSSSYDSAIQYRGLFWIDRGYRIDVMSRSRITNPRSVWRMEK